MANLCGCLHYINWGRGFHGTPDEYCRYEHSPNGVTFESCPDYCPVWGKNDVEDVVARKPRKEVTMRFNKIARARMEKLFEMMKTRDELVVIRQALQMFQFLLTEQEKGAEFFWRRHDTDKDSEPEKIDLFDYKADEE